MPHAEAKYVMSFISTLAAALGYAWLVREPWAAGVFAGPSGAQTAGQWLLGFIIAVVGAGILGQILLAICYGIAGGSLPASEDERDWQIELRAMNIAFNVFCIGFLGAIIALALGFDIIAVLHAIIAAMVVCGLVADVCRIWLHRRGF